LVSRQVKGRTAQRLPQPFRDIDGLAALATHKDRELLAAEASQDIAISQRAPQPARNRLLSTWSS